MDLLDPQLDIVFKLLLTREPELLHDMLEGILARPLEHPTLLDPDLPREHTDDKQIIFDIRVALHDGTRIDLEMQRRTSPVLTSRLVYYAARDYADQLHWGDEYHLLTPTIGIIWLAEPLVPAIERFHSIFELRERHIHTRLNDQLTLHLLQLSHLRPSAPLGYTASVQRWARFLTTRDEAALDRLAAEHPIMTLAKQTLEQLSDDPQAQRLARYRQDEAKLYEIDRLAWRLESEAKGRAKGRAEGEARLLLKLLALRFGPVPEEFRAQMQSSTLEQLDTWGERVLTAATLDEVFSP